MKFDLPEHAYNYDLLKKLSRLIEQLHITKEEEQIYYDMIHNGRFISPFRNDELEKFIKELEKHIAGEQVDLSFMLYFMAMDRDEKFHSKDYCEQYVRKFKSEQETKVFTRQRLSALEKYLRLVDSEWEDPKIPHIPTKYSQSDAIDEVWGKYSAEIIKIIKHYNRDKPNRHKKKVTKGTFASIFKKYLKVCIKHNDRKTLDGRIISERKK